MKLVEKFAMACHNQHAVVFYKQRFAAWKAIRVLLARRALGPSLGLDSIIVVMRIIMTTLTKCILIADKPSDCLYFVNESLVLAYKRFRSHSRIYCTTCILDYFQVYELQIAFLGRLQLAYSLIFVFIAVTLYDFLVLQIYVKR